AAAHVRPPSAFPTRRSSDLLAVHPARLPVRPRLLAVRHGRPAHARGPQGDPAHHLADPPLQPPDPRGARSGPGAGHVEQSTPTAAPGPLGPTLVRDSRPQPAPRMNDMRIRAAGRPG